MFRRLQLLIACGMVALEDLTARFRIETSDPVNRELQGRGQVIGRFQGYHNEVPGTTRDNNGPEDLKILHH
nr:uncharacterized protein CTRU02_05072 [Colletotrichum truncatum]KAF6794871.1 hypothetical protein CTRU02_05072 [Colletotrichum truncatum]